MRGIGGLFNLTSDYLSTKTLHNQAVQDTLELFTNSARHSDLKDIIEQNIASNKIIFKINKGTTR